MKYGALTDIKYTERQISGTKESYFKKKTLFVEIYIFQNVIPMKFIGNFVTKMADIFIKY